MSRGLDGETGLSLPDSLCECCCPHSQSRRDSAPDSSTGSPTRTSFHPNGYASVRTRFRKRQLRQAGGLAPSERVHFRTALEAGSPPPPNTDVGPQGCPEACVAVDVHRLPEFGDLQASLRKVKERPALTHPPFFT